MDRTKLIGLAGELFQRHGLDVQGWRLAFRRYGHRLGCCSSRKKTITLNDFYVDNNDEAHVLDTLLHEIAHALVGPLHGHGPLWKAMARRLGCTPKACSKTGLITRPGKWGASCPNCNRTFQKYRKPRYMQGYFCPSCGEERGRLVFAMRAGDDGYNL